MTFANIWLGLRDDANTLVREYLSWDEESQGEYSGPVSNRAGRIFRFFSDIGTVSKLYKAPTLGGNVWHLYNINIDIVNYTPQEVRDEIDWLVATYGTQVSMVGAWKWTGEQYGTTPVWDTRTVTKTWSVLNPDYDPNEFLDEEQTVPNPAYDPRFVLRITGDVEEDYISSYTGSPLYPIPKVQLLNFMPDVDGSPATVLTDVNLLAGQSPRDFTA